MNRITARLPDNLMDAIKSRALADKSSVAEVVREALAKHFGVSLLVGERTFNIPAWVNPYGSGDQPAFSVTLPCAVVAQLQASIKGGRSLSAMKDLREWSFTHLPEDLGLYHVKCVVRVLAEELLCP